MPDDITSIRMTVTMPNGTRQDFAVDGPPEMALDAYRLFMAAPVTSSAPSLPLAADPDVPTPLIESEPRKAQADSILVALLAHEAIYRTRLIDRMRASGWTESQVRESMIRLERQGVIDIAERGRGRTPDLLRLRPFDESQSEVA